MSWLKGVFDSAKETKNQVEAEKERLRRIFDQNNHVVLQLLHEASDLLWGRHGLVRKQSFFEPKPRITAYFQEPGGRYSSFRIGWCLTKQVGNTDESLNVTLSSDSSFSVYYSSSFRYGPSRTTSNQSTTEDELKKALTEILDWRVQMSQRGGS